MQYSTSKGINLYPTSGTASDWYVYVYILPPSAPLQQILLVMQSRFACMYSRFYSRDAAGDYRSAGLTVELRDKGEYGFLLPANQVQCKTAKFTLENHFEISVSFSKPSKGVKL